MKKRREVSNKLRKKTERKKKQTCKLISDVRRNHSFLYVGLFAVNRTFRISYWRFTSVEMMEFPRKMTVEEHRNLHPHPGIRSNLRSGNLLCLYRFRILRPRPLASIAAGGVGAVGISDSDRKQRSLDSIRSTDAAPAILACEQEKYHEKGILSSIGWDLSLCDGDF